MADEPHGLGYLFDHPTAIESRDDFRNWPMSLLLEGEVPEPYQTVADFDHDTGPMLDQDGIGACVAFCAEVIRNWQEYKDEGRFPFTTASAFTSYNWLKHGHGTWPGDGAPNVEGSWPGAVWRMAQIVGMPGADGKARKIAEYYQLQGDPGSQTWLDTLFAVTSKYGPVSVSSIWPTSWFTSPGANGVMRPPSGNSGGGHMWTVKGKRTLPGVGSGIFAVCRQTWGDGWGIRDKYGRPGEFLIDVAWFTNPLLRIGECWKTIDVPGDNPPGVILKYGGYLGYRGNWRVIANGSRFRSKPYLSAPIVGKVDAGFTWRNSQTTDKGSVVNGSARWLGDATGDRWMHRSLVTLVK